MQKSARLSFIGRLKQNAKAMRMEDARLKGNIKRFPTTVPLDRRAEFKSKIPFYNGTALPRIHGNYCATMTVPKRDTIEATSSVKPRYCAQHQMTSDYKAVRSMPDVTLAKVAQRSSHMERAKSTVLTRRHQYSPHTPCGQEQRQHQRRQRRPHRQLTFICDDNRCYQIDAVPKMSFPNREQRLPKGVLVCDGLKTCMVNYIPNNESVYSQQQVAQRDVPREVVQHEKMSEAHTKQQLVHAKEQRGNVPQEIVHQVAKPEERAKQQRVHVKEQRGQYVREEYRPSEQFKEESREQNQRDDEIGTALTSAEPSAHQSTVPEEMAIFICNETACYQVTEMPTYAMHNHFPEALSGVFVCKKSDSSKLPSNAHHLVARVNDRSDYSINRYMNSKEPKEEHVEAKTLEEPSDVFLKHGHTAHSTRHHMRQYR